MSGYFNIEKWIKDKLFNIVPMAIAIIDRDFNVAMANPEFEKLFGPWHNQKCYQVYKDKTNACDHCRWPDAFLTCKVKIHEEMGYNNKGKITRYMNHTMPIQEENGQINYLIVMTTDITESEQLKREHQLLFDQVPCSLLVINRDFKIVKTNQRLRDMLGSLEGRQCFESLKGFSEKCSECTAHQTFIDGELHTGLHTWKTQSGEIHQFQVTTVPIRSIDDSFDLVMEMAVDVTQILKLEDELKIAHAFMETMIATSIDGIVAMDDIGNVTILNPAARAIFNLEKDYHLSQTELNDILPPNFLDNITGSDRHLIFPETEINTLDNQIIPIRLAGTKLNIGKRFMGYALWIQDLRKLKTLEKEKLEAERLAAVGQTVAGLAHGVKNLITGLEGGLYMLSTGMSKSKMDRIQKGLDMLTRNIDRISKFVKTFLSFSKGRIIQVTMSNPNDIAKEVVDVYITRAAELGIALNYESGGDILNAPLDYESIHESLTNLVGNAIDACRMSENDNRTVKVKTYEKDDTIFFEVIDDGCGMDYEVKQKVFTNFFTTKGLGGTGIGLLMTKKIVHEHGGKIELESEPGKGTVFRIRLPRTRLPQPIANGQPE